MNTSLNLSRVAELDPLADLVRTLDSATAHDWFIIGATARDLLLHHGHGMPIRPDGNPVMTVLGFEEAARNTVSVLLPGGISVNVATIPALFVLKLIAWNERHFERPRDDARDISMLLASYAAPWNQDRLYDTAADLLEAFGFDNERAAAALLSRDAAAIAQRETRERILAIAKRPTRLTSSREKWTVAWRTT